MGEAASAASDLAIVTSDNPRTEDPREIIRQIEAGIRTTRFADAGEWSRHPGASGYIVIADRKEAIAAAIALADAADIVLIAGKGHEDYQIVGRQKFPFDDRLIARAELARRESGRGGHDR
jgi:UDP-N-acetylmuramoyl-L-alanyl-D-glutamate--2,6-diaminopimelate ligase